MSARLFNPLFVVASLLAPVAADSSTDGVSLPAGDCGTRLTSGDVRLSLEAERNGVYRFPVRKGDSWQVRTAVHIVRTDAGLGGMTEGQLAAALDKLNEDFAPSGIGFSMVGPVDYIDSDAFYFDIDTMAEIDLLRATNPVPGAVNLYFTGNMPFCGISSFSWQAVQGIVLVNACVVSPWNPSTFSHEVGHYFDLVHTHETAYGAECVDGSNCATAGDLICDTPADPHLDRCGPGGNEYCVDSSCRYTGDFLDGCSADPYEPSTDNLMSYSRPMCRSSFTPEQCSRSAATLLNVRSDHILDPVAVGPPDAEHPHAFPPRLMGPFPNPAVGRITYGVQVTEAGFIQVGLFSATGRRVATLLGRRLSPGRHSLHWEPPGLVAPGVYYLVLTSRRSSESHRLTWMSGVRP